MAAIVGAAGLAPTLAAARRGKRVLLANKEALVMSGALFMDEVRHSGALLLPIDSEHNAIFQCMPADFRPVRSCRRAADTVDRLGRSVPHHAVGTTRTASRRSRPARIPTG